MCPMLLTGSDNMNLKFLCSLSYTKILSCGLHGWSSIVLTCGPKPTHLCSPSKLHFQNHCYSERASANGSSVLISTNHEDP
jgi:hypothetical protein